jgi:hypothetical protein
MYPAAFLHRIRAYLMYSIVYASASQYKLDQSAD